MRWACIVAACASAAVATPDPLDFLPAGLLSAEELAAVAAAAERIATRAPCRRVFSRHGGMHRSADLPMGGRLVQPVADRRVKVSAGFGPHMDAAVGLPFPLDARLRAASLPAELACAVAHSFELGTSLADARDRALADMRREADALRPVSAKINSMMPPSVAMIAAAPSAVKVLRVAVFM